MIISPRLIIVTLRLMSVTLRLMKITLRFITILARKNKASPHLFESHTFIEKVKPFYKVFCFL